MNNYQKIVELTDALKNLIAAVEHGMSIGQIAKDDDWYVDAVDHAKNVLQRVAQAQQVDDEGR